MKPLLQQETKRKCIRYMGMKEIKGKLILLSMLHLTSAYLNNGDESNYHL
jgi:hypothetical protein